MTEDKKELLKQKGYTAADWGIGALLAGLFVGIVVVVARVTVNGFAKIIPSIQSDKK